jgi:hypothetical protein
VRVPQGGELFTEGNSEALIPQNVKKPETLAQLISQTQDPRADEPSFIADTTSIKSGTSQESTFLQGLSEDRLSPLQDGELLDLLLAAGDKIDLADSIEMLGFV